MGTILRAIENLSHAALRGRGFVSRTISAGLEPVHAYDAQGRGSFPPVVIVHGLGASAASFARVAVPLLSVSKRVVLLDMPGHGRSVVPLLRPLTPRTVFRAVVHALDGLLDEPFVLVGNSLGGAAALAHAIERPERTRGLFLLSPAGAHLPGDHAAEVLATFRMRGRPEGRRFLDKLYHRAPLYTHLVAHELPRWMGREPVRDLLEHAHEIAFSTDELAKLTVPTVLSWGKSERLLPASGLAFLKAHLPAHVRIEEPDGVGHCPQLDDPRALARRLAAFLAEVGSS